MELDQPEQVALFNSFTVKRAQWSESNVAGPASTPDANGAIYTNDFSSLEFSFSILLYRGCRGDQASRFEFAFWWTWWLFELPHTYRYINDFDPGVDVEITAGLNQGALARGLICRYSQDGWYQAHYVIDAGGSAVVITLVERDSQGILKDVVLGMDGRKTKEGQELSFTCVGNQITVSLNGEVRVSVVDNTWRTGRYGLMLLADPPGNLRSGFTSLTIRQAPPPPDEIISDTPETIISNFRLDPQSPGVKVVDAVLTLTSSNETPVHLNSMSAQVDNETTLEVEFPHGGGEIVMHCRLGSPSFLSFGLRSNGGWNIFADNNQLAAADNSALLHAGKNQITLRCVRPNYRHRQWGDLGCCRIFSL